MRLPSTPTRTSTPRRASSREDHPDWDEAPWRSWRAIALGFVEMERLGVYGGQDWRCSDLELYGTCAHGFSPAQTAAVLRIGRKLLELPEVDRALRHGWLTWEHVVLLSQVVVPRYEGAWLDLALDLPLAELASLVERSAEGWAPPSACDVRANAGGAAAERLAEAIEIESWRHRARPGRGRFAGGHRRMAPPLRDRAREGRATRFLSNDGAPNVRQVSGAPPSTS